jgi:hypothetical protein
MPPLIIAVIGSFGCNYLHPFLDGNGRVHRYLFHALLAWSQAIPPGTVAPISPDLHAIKWRYRNALEDFSDRIMLALDHEPDTKTDELKIASPRPLSLYQHWDATAVVELMHDVWVEAVQSMLEQKDEQDNIH